MAEQADLQRTVYPQPQVERRIAKVRLSDTDVLPLCHATNRFLTKYFVLPTHLVVPLLTLKVLTATLLDLVNTNLAVSI